MLDDGSLTQAWERQHVTRGMGAPVPEAPIERYESGSHDCVEKFLRRKALVLETIYFQTSLVGRTLQVVTVRSAAACDVAFFLLPQSS